MADDGFDYNQTSRYGTDYQGSPQERQLNTPKDRPQIGIGNGSQSSMALAMRQRQMGEGFAGRQAYQTDFGQSNQARGQQSNALGLMRSAALGAQPSQAQILGRGMVDDSLHAQMAGAAAARGGPMGQMVAQRMAAQNAAGMQQQGMNSLAALRAQEMAGARDAYMAGATGMRGQDLNAAGLQQNSELTQRALNQSGQLAAEGMANDIDKSQAALDMQGRANDDANWRAQQALQEQHWEAQTNTNQHTTDRNTGLLMNVLGGAANAGAGVLSGLAKLSDPAAKKRVQALSQPMGGSGKSWIVDPGDVDRIRFGGGDDDIDRIRYGANASDDALDDRAAQFSSGRPEWLEQHMVGQQLTDDASSQIVPSAIPKGVAGAPQGYAAMRAAQMGAPSSPDDGELAPGQADWDRYGAGAANAGPVDWTQGGATPQAAKPGVGALAANGLANMGSGMANFGTALATRPVTSDPRSKVMSPMSGPAPTSFESMSGGGTNPMGSLQAMSNVATQFATNPTGPLTISDPRAKREAFMEGINFGDAMMQHAQGTGPEPTPPKYMPNTVQPLKRDGIHFVREKPQHADTMSSSRPWQGEEPPPAQAAPPAQMMDAIGGGKAFQYKDGVPGEDPNKPHFGTTTEDLKKTPMGASVVVPGSPATGGFEAIDTREAVGPTFAALGNLNQRMRALEAEYAPRGKRAR